MGLRIIRNGVENHVAGVMRASLESHNIALKFSIRNLSIC